MPTLPNAPMPEPHHESFFSEILQSLASYLLSGVIFLFIVGGLVYFVHFMLLLLQDLWIKLVEFLHSFAFFNRIFLTIEEKKKSRILKKLHLPPPVKYQTEEEKALRCNACAICLEDFKDGELCQVLPLCYHAFHSPCIKPWLVNNQICPNCRSPITKEKPLQQERSSAQR